MILGEHESNPPQRTSGASRRARRARFGFVWSLGIACALGLAVLGHLPAGATLQGEGPAAADQESPGGFQIGGTVRGLYPGDSAELVLTVTNPQRFAIVVTDISTTVGSPGAGCKARYLRVHAFTGQLRVDALASAQLTVRVVLRHAAPDRCQGALFPLHYVGLARKA